MTDDLASAILNLGSVLGFGAMVLVCMRRKPRVDPRVDPRDCEGYERDGFTNYRTRQPDDPVVTAIMGAEK
jgi:hypothetical protein